MRQTTWPAVTAACGIAVVVLTLAFVRARREPPNTPPLVTQSPAPQASIPGRTPRDEMIDRIAQLEPPPYTPARSGNLEGELAARFTRAMTRYTARDYAGARAALEELKANAPPVLFYLGITQLQTGNAAAAATTFDTLIAASAPAFEEDAHFFMAKTTLALGKVDRARGELVRVVAYRGPREREAQALLAAIDHLPPA